MLPQNVPESDTGFLSAAKADLLRAGYIVRAILDGRRLWMDADGHHWMESPTEADQRRLAPVAMADLARLDPIIQNAFRIHIPVHTPRRVSVGTPLALTPAALPVFHTAAGGLLLKQQQIMSTLLPHEISALPFRVVLTSDYRWLPRIPVIYGIQEPPAEACDLQRYTAWLSDVLANTFKLLQVQADALLQRASRCNSADARRRQVRRAARRASRKSAAKDGARTQ